MGSFSLIPSIPEDQRLAPQGNHSAEQLFLTLNMMTAHKSCNANVVISSGNNADGEGTPTANYYDAPETQGSFGGGAWSSLSFQKLGSGSSGIASR